MDKKLAITMKPFFIFSFLFLLAIEMPQAQVWSDTTAVRKEVDSLVRLNRELLTQRRFQHALPVIERAQSTAESFFGKYSAEYADALFGHAVLNYMTGKFDVAEQQFLECRDIRASVLGKDHLDYAKTLNNLGIIYIEKGQLQQAEPLLLEVRRIRELKLGKEHPEYTKLLINLGSVYVRTGRLSLGEEVFLEVKNIRNRTNGTNSLEYVQALNNLGAVSISMGKIEAAETYLAESMTLAERLLGVQHPDYQKSATNLANIYMQTSRYEDAEWLLVQARKQIEKYPGKKHADYGTISNNLGVAYFEMRKFELAEKAYADALEVWKNLNGKEHPYYMSGLVNLANIYINLNRIEEGENAILEAKGLFEKTGQTDHPEYYKLLNSLGINFIATNRLEEAGSLFQNLAASLKLKSKDTSPEYASILSNQATVCAMEGQLEKAGSYLDTAINIYKHLGLYNSSYSELLGSMAAIYMQMGQFKKSIQLNTEAIEYYNASADTSNLRFSSLRYNMALLLRQTASPESADSAYISLLNLSRHILTKATRYFSEKELQEYIRTLYFYLDEYFSFCYNMKNKEKANSGTCYDNTLFFNGFILQDAKAIRNFIAHDSVASAKFNLQKSYYRQLSKEFAKPIKERKKDKILEWEEKANTLEKEIVDLISRQQRYAPEISWKEIKQHLYPGTAAVEFIRFAYLANITANVTYFSPPPSTDSTLYAALVLLPTDTAPHFIPLFEERQLQALLHRPELGEELTVKGLYASNSELLNLLWTPLEPLLRDVKTVYYSPAGLLHRVNPAALRGADKQPMSAGREWVRVGSTRELVTGRLADRSYALDPNAYATAAVWGGIRYDMDSTAFVAANPLDPKAGPLPEFERKDGKFRYMVEDGAPALSTGLRGAGDEGWKPLAGSAREAGQVGELLQKAGFRTELFSDYTASEERFKALGQGASSPRILHVATHGFAYPDPKTTPGAEAPSFRRGLGEAEPVYKLQDDPMLRSGLLLAGANHYWTAKRPLQDREDGVLVAYEVRDLNLRNTELAVLSACQTGLGDVVGSEGVYGLQRAFRIAGAKFLIVSLWQVPDEQTRELMRLFYENWVDKRESLRDAFNHAQATLREQEPNPYMWAGFVLIE